jgi:hypothetical protein
MDEICRTLGRQIHTQVQVGKYEENRGFGLQVNVLLDLEKAERDNVG